jgi:catechol 2,3-dioxygenase-like lactoylglutathione lyase family enzyme
MTQFISRITLLVPDYDAGIAFYVDQLGFRLIEDSWVTDGKRWVVVAPPGSRETALLLAKAAGPDQAAAIGRQAGGRVFLFLNTDDFDRDHGAMLSAGVTFLEAPRHERYGKVAVFEDPFGNRWDLIEPAG